jgi:hypothetical protein
VTEDAPQVVRDEQPGKQCCVVVGHSKLLEHGSGEIAH